MMTSAELFRQHIEQIVPLTDSEFEYIMSFFVFKQFRKHQFLVQAGSHVAYEYFVLKGCLKSYYIDEEGREHIIQFSLQNWWTTDYQAFLTQTPATMHIDCIEATEVLAITYEQKEKLCATLQKMEHFSRRKCNSGYAAMQRRVLSLLTLSAKERYEQLLAQYPQLLQKIPKTLIAAYLGVSRETLSRLSSAKKK